MATLEMFGIALILIILFGGACFYMYSRMVYSEKRIGLMESILLDVKMAMESVEDSMRAPMPMTPPFGGGAPIPQASEKVVGDSIQDDQFYSQLLKEVTDEHAGHIVPESEPAVEAAPSLDLGAAPPAEVVPTPAGSPYDAMSRQDLLNLLERRGLRVTKRAGRGEMISVLRNSDASANRSSETGTEDVSKETASSMDNAAPLAAEPLQPLEEVLSV